MHYAGRRPLSSIRWPGIRLRAGRWPGGCPRVGGLGSALVGLGGLGGAPAELGVAPELVEEVFTRGFTTKAANGGPRGFGLALTWTICTRRGGTVSVSNDHGAVFTASLPLPVVTAGVR